MSKLGKKIRAGDFGSIHVRCKNEECGAEQDVVAQKLADGGWDILDCCEECGMTEFNILWTNKNTR